jgi:hypothetical protein
VYVTVLLVSPGAKVTLPGVFELRIFHVYDTVPPPFSATEMEAVKTMLVVVPQGIPAKLLGFTANATPVRCSRTGDCAGVGEDAGDDTAVVVGVSVEVWSEVPLVGPPHATIPSTAMQVKSIFIIECFNILTYLKKRYNYLQRPEDIPLPTTFGVSTCVINSS